MSLADYLAKNYLTADAPSEKRSKKRKRKGTADPSAGLIIADDDAAGWNTSTNASSRDEDDGPVMGINLPLPHLPFPSPFRPPFPLARPTPSFGSHQTPELTTLQSATPPPSVNPPETPGNPSAAPLPRTRTKPPQTPSSPPQPPTAKPSRKPPKTPP